MPDVNDPQTPAEWQDAVDGAAFFLLAKDAKDYGLVTGGPPTDIINVPRCHDLLKRGAALGYTPSPDYAEMGVAVWQAHCQEVADARDH